MKHRLILQTALPLAPLAALHAATPAQKPNILVMFADDLGYADLGCQGSPEVKTPHIDSLAANGVRCTAGYVTAPQCSPSRAGLVSGRYQQRFGHEENHNKPVMLMKGGKTIGDQFKAAGYATAHFGKWHLGYEIREEAPKEFDEKGDWMAPAQHGFDESIGFHDREKPAPNSDRKRQPKQAQDDRDFARKTADFIGRHKDNPRCVYLAFHAPHGTHEVLFWRWRREQAVRTGDWKLVRSEDKHFGHRGWALIDFKTDIEEWQDLTAEHPEIARELPARWDRWNASLPPIGPDFQDDETEK